MHPDEEEQAIHRFEENARRAMERLQNFLMSKSIQEMKTEIQELSDEDLAFLCEIALANENYEICQVVTELLHERKAG